MSEHSMALAVLALASAGAAGSAAALAVLSWRALLARIHRYRMRQLVLARLARMTARDL